MKKALSIAVVSVAALAFIGTSSAVPPGKKVVYKGAKKGKYGKVVFDGKKHKEKGLTCKDCHPALFGLPKKGKEKVKITMQDINAGKFCGACHNGEKAFKASDAKNCMKCHRKKKKVIKGC